MSSLQMGAVHLHVANLEHQIAFYSQNIGLQLLAQDGTRAVLGVGNRDLLVLTAHPDWHPAPPRATGLYHFAILVPSRLELARTFKNLIETKTRMQGFSDHLVSEALYLADPEGNGIEIYADRPRSQWSHRDGMVQMDTIPLDIHGLLAELNGQAPTFSGLHPDTLMGHVHMHVGDLKSARAFYTDLIGFDVVFSMPSALFVSEDGYHHHLGLNTWKGQGALPPPPRSLGIDYYEIVQPDEEALQAVVSRLEGAGITPAIHPQGYLVHDPSQNGIMLTTSARKDAHPATSAIEGTPTPAE